MRWNESSTCESKGNEKGRCHRSTWGASREKGQAQAQRATEQTGKQHSSWKECSWKVRQWSKDVFSNGTVRKGQEHSLRGTNEECMQPGALPQGSAYRNVVRLPHCSTKDLSGAAKGSSKCI